MTTELLTTCLVCQAHLFWNKLLKIQPETLGQASPISGVSPADVSVLMVYLNRQRVEAAAITSRPVPTDHLGRFVAAVAVSVAGFGATLLAIVWREWGRPHLDFTYLDMVPVFLVGLQVVLVAMGVAGSLRSFRWERYGRALVWVLLTAALLAAMLAEYTGWFIAVVGVASPADGKVDHPEMYYHPPQQPAPHQLPA